MWAAIASAIRPSFCGALNTQRRLSSIGATILEEAARLISGTLASAATSISASETGVTEEPTMASTLSSLASLRALATPLVVSVASSRTIHSTFWPPISVGSSVTVLACGMPSEAAGPVLAMVTPILIGCASTGPARTVPARASAQTMRFMVVSSRLRAAPVVAPVAGVTGLR